MNLKPTHKDTIEQLKKVSIPNRDFMNLKLVIVIGLETTQNVSIPNRDFMNLKQLELIFEVDKLEFQSLIGIL